MNELLISRHDHVLQLTPNRPQVCNALNNVLLTQIAGALESAVADASISICMINGNPRYLVTGANLNEMTERDLSATFDDTRPRPWARIDAFNKPPVAVVNGYVLGVSCELTLPCDLMITGDSARFGLSEITPGTMPGAGDTQRLIRSVGKALASRMVPSGGSADAERA